jgi:hypothetical protein
MQPPDHVPLDGTKLSLTRTDVDDDCIMHQLSRDQLRLLWHQRLGYIDARGCRRRPQGSYCD